MSDTFKLKIVTANRNFYDDDIEMVIFKTTEGEIGVLKGHIPLTTGLTSGMAIIQKSDEKEKTAVLHGGFAEITSDQVTIITDAAEWPDELDLVRAREAKIRAEQQLTEKDLLMEEMQMLKAKASLTRALVRIEVAEYHSDLDENNR
ncbi:MAG: ATP synthase F1 subunit epsilon [Vallitaleaceae bacterium]|jgi:F-type H+-transporting ATPase subunit epsilon|nr:ATP synthase F1 subunit epsilon [Vallitaleaceae bacterium]